MQVLAGKEDVDVQQIQLAERSNILVLVLIDHLEHAEDNALQAGGCGGGLGVGPLCGVAQVLEGIGGHAEYALRIRIDIRSRKVEGPVKVTPIHVLINNGGRIFQRLDDLFDQIVLLDQRIDRLGVGIGLILIPVVRILINAFVHQDLHQQRDKHRDEVCTVFFRFTVQRGQIHGKRGLTGDGVKYTKPAHVEGLQIRAQIFAEIKSRESGHKIQYAAHRQVGQIQTRQIGDGELVADIQHGVDRIQYRLYGTENILHGNGKTVGVDVIEDAGQPVKQPGDGICLDLVNEIKKHLDHRIDEGLAVVLVLTGAAFDLKGAGLILFIQRIALDRLKQRDKAALVKVQTVEDDLVSRCRDILVGAGAHGLEQTVIGLQEEERHQLRGGMQQLLQRGDKGIHVADVVGIGFHEPLVVFVCVILDNGFCVHDAVVGPALRKLRSGKRGIGCGKVGRIVLRLGILGDHILAVAVYVIRFTFFEFRTEEDPVDGGEIFFALLRGSIGGAHVPGVFIFHLVLAVDDDPVVDPDVEVDVERGADKPYKACGHFIVQLCNKADDGLHHFGGGKLVV